MSASSGSSVFAVHSALCIYREGRRKKYLYKENSFPPLFGSQRRVGIANAPLSHLFRSMSHAREYSASGLWIALYGSEH